MKKVGTSAYFLLLAIGLANSQAHFHTTADYNADQYVTSGLISLPRSVIRDEFGDILVLSQGASHITAVYEVYKDVKTAVIVEAKLGLNHGLVYNSGYLYASTSSKVLRWGYSPGQRTKVTVSPEVVVRGIPGDGDHQTRTLIVDRFNHLYVSVGSASNVEESNTRSQIRRFNLAEGLPTDGFEYEKGEIFAKGVRNAVGLAFDQGNSLWGVDCGADGLYREGLGGDIHNSNPADELIRFDAQGTAYGYPYCWTVGELFGYQRGQQLAWPNYMNDTVHTDAWCQTVKNNHPPTLSLPAHNAPLGLVFYDGVGCDSQPGSFPCSMKGDLFVAFHGSWNREPPAGYKVVRLSIDPNTRLPTGESEDIIFEANPSTCGFTGTKCFRPVDVVFSQSGHLIVSSDSSNDIIRISHKHSNDDSGFIPGVKKSLHVPGIIALTIIAIFTTGVVIMFVRRYCCCRQTEVPYSRETI